MFTIPLLAIVIALIMALLYTNISIRSRENNLLDELSVLRERARELELTLSRRADLDAEQLLAEPSPQHVPRIAAPGQTSSAGERLDGVAIVCCLGESIQ